MAAGLCDEEITMEKIRGIMDTRMVDVRQLLIGVAKEYASAASLKWKFCGLSREYMEAEVGPFEPRYFGHAN